MTIFRHKRQWVYGFTLVGAIAALGVGQAMLQNKAEAQRSTG